jgi:hypothetical protein
VSDARREAPWTTAQARVVTACDLVAALVVAGAATSARHQGSLQDQITWIDLAVVGLLLAVVANGTLFLVGRRAVGGRRLDVLPDAVAPVTATRPPTAEGRWWWLPGTTRAHVAGCQLIAGKAAQEVSADRIRSERLVRCEVCG